LSRRDIVALRQELSKLKNEANLTFQPQITPRGQSKTAKANRFESLYKDAMKRRDEDPKSKLKSKIDESNLTFKPQITPRGRSKSVERQGTSLVDRFYNASGSGRPKSPDSRNEDLFKPKITKRASSLDRGTMDIQKRLYAADQRSKEQFEKKKEVIQLNKQKECTFTPRTNPTHPRSRSGSVSASDTSSQNGFERPPIALRMQKFSAEKQRKIDEIKKSLEDKELEGVTFQPEIFTSSSGKKSAWSVKDSDKPVHERLSKPHQKDLQKAIEAITRELTFQPQVNKTPPAIAASLKESNKDVHERLFDAVALKKQNLEESVRFILFFGSICCPQFTKMSHSS
jgi:hypothetical protein